MKVVDELSDDETPQRLQEYGIRMVTPPERLGVTYNWNLVRDAGCCPLRRRLQSLRRSPAYDRAVQLGAGAWVLWACCAASRAWLHGVQAYRTWLETEHEWLFYVNNDVLVPDGAIDAMAQAMTAAGAGRCSPLGLDHSFFASNHGGLSRRGCQVCTGVNDSVTAAA